MLIYGHRGAKGEAPENTLAGFEYAYSKGIRRFEMDLLLSGSGEPVVNHDLTTERTTGVKGKIGEMSVEALSELDARHGTPAWPEPCRIPTLHDVLAICPEFAHLQLEVKPDQRRRMDRLCDQLVALVQDNHWYERIVVTSSDGTFLSQIKRQDNNLQTGLVFDRRFADPIKSSAQLKCHYLCLNWKLCSTAVVDAAHAAGMHVSVWTVNHLEDMQKLGAMGVDSIITDYPVKTLTSQDPIFSNPDHPRTASQG